MIKYNLNIVVCVNVQNIFIIPLVFVITTNTDYKRTICNYEILYASCSKDIQLLVYTGSV